MSESTQQEIERLIALPPSGTIRYEPTEGGGCVQTMRGIPMSRPPSPAPQVWERIAEAACCDALRADIAARTATMSGFYNNGKHYAYPWINGYLREFDSSLGEMTDTCPHCGREFPVEIQEIES